MRACLLAIALLSCLPAQAGASVCPAPTGQPQVTIIPMLPTPPESHTASYHELSKKLSRALKPDSDAMGLSSAELGGNVDGDFKLLIRQGRSCYYLKALTVHFGYTYRLVEIAREVPEGSCMFKEIREHEYKHVSVDNAILRDNLPYVQTQLQDFADGLGALEAANAEAAEKQLTAAIKSKMKSILTHVWKLENAAQDQIDTESEYTRVANACRVQLDPNAKAIPVDAPATPTHPPGVGGK
jgi:hypothetical protein